MARMEDELFNGRDFDYKKLMKFHVDLISGKPRVAAILGGAYIDYLLNKLLRKRLVQSKELFENHVDKLSMAQKIILCYLCGLLSKEEKASLMKIKNIRNQFAHRISLKGFNERTSEMNIPDVCDKLLPVERIKKVDKNFVLVEPLIKFKMSVQIHGELLKSKLKTCILFV